MSDDAFTRDWFRGRNLAVRGTILRVDDTGPVQLHQVEALLGEVREALQHHQPFGLTVVPLAGAKVLLAWPGGHRGFGSVHGVEDPRYRPTGGQSGEVHVYMVDGAGGDGSGGTTRSLLRGVAGWITSLFGKTITLGTATDTAAISVAGQTITISSAGNITVTGITGDVVVNGISLVNHVHPDAQGGTTGRPQ